MRVRNIYWLVVVASLITSCKPKVKNYYENIPSTFVTVTNQTRWSCVVTVNGETFTIPFDDIKFTEALRVAAANTQKIAIASLDTKSDDCWGQALKSVHAAGFSRVGTN